jgi:hypothetical protein
MSRAVCRNRVEFLAVLTPATDSIRVEGFHDWPPGPGAPDDYDYQPELRYGEEDYYRNYYPHHAPTWLAAWLDRICSLDVIPVNYGGYRRLFKESQTKVCRACAAKL